MKAFVINEDQIKNAVMMLAGALLFAFMLGYYFGSQLSTTVELPIQANQNADSEVDTAQAENEVSQENLIAESKKQDEASEKRRLQQKKEMAAKKAAEKKEQAKKEVAKKELARKEALKKEAAKKELARKEAAKKEAAKKDKARKELAKKELAKKEQARKEAAQKEEISAQNNSNTVVSNKNEAGSDINDVQTSLESDDADVEKKVYSIQAGMFASEANANSFIDKLAAKQFDAYVSSFLSSSGATKYNVRVGRFAERDQARLLLKEFQKSFSSPAYVVITR